jgi:hypothetical protein
VIGAFGAAVSALFVGLVALIFLRGSGGWMCLYRLRRGHVRDGQGRGWTELGTLERAWFYGAPVWLTAAVIFAALGVALSAYLPDGCSGGRLSGCS